jgi:hypothetical protein
VDREALHQLEERMFIRSEEAGPAGNYQWGRNAGPHQDHWDPYQWWTGQQVTVYETETESEHEVCTGMVEELIYSFKNSLVLAIKMINQISLVLRLPPLAKRLNRDHIRGINSKHMNTSLHLLSTISHLSFLLRRTGTLSTH